MKRILSIVEAAYRATIEEQDDTILWLNHAMKNFGGDISILLSGNAVNYAVKGQAPREESLSDSILLRPPDLNQDLTKMIAKGITVYFTHEDAVERGLAETEWISGVTKISRNTLPELFNGFDQIWYW